MSESMATVRSQCPVVRFDSLMKANARPPPDRGAQSSLTLGSTATGATLADLRTALHHTPLAGGRRWPDDETADAHRRGLLAFVVSGGSP